MDLYDKADNLLLYVTFDYDNGGKLLKRDIFAPDGYFIRSVVIERDGAGRPVKEISRNFNDQEIAHSLYAYAGGQVSYSLFDDVRTLFGAGYASGKASSVPISSQDNLSVSKINYQYANDLLDRITVLDKQGVMSHYLEAIYPTSARMGSHRTMVKAPAVQFIAQKGISVNFALEKASLVQICLHDIAGRKIAEMVHERFVQGDHAWTGSFSDLGLGPAAGVYFINVSIGDYDRAYSMRIVR